jgi:hypothetical protein
MLASKLATRSLEPLNLNLLVIPVAMAVEVSYELSSLFKFNPTGSAINGNASLPQKARPLEKVGAILIELTLSLSIDAD